MLNAILVPLDGSKTAERALPYALRLASHTTCQAILLHVAPSRSSSLSEPVHAYRYIADLSRQFVETGSRSTTVLRRGDPLTEIVNEVHEALADLVVMSTHGTSLSTSRLMGGIPYALLHRIHVPLLLLNNGCEVCSTTGRHIVLVLDSAAHAAGTMPPIERLGSMFDFTAELAAALGSRVTIFQAARPNRDALSALDPSVTYADVEIYNERLPSMVEDGLQGPVRTLQEYTVKANIVSAEGDVNIALQNYLASHPADLIVFAVQRQSNYSRRIMDELVQTALGFCDTPTMIYPLHTPISHREQVEPIPLEYR